MIYIILFLVYSFATNTLSDLEFNFTLFIFLIFGTKANINTIENQTLIAHNEK